MKSTGWSKRRRQFRKRYDWRKHQWKLIYAQMLEELYGPIIEKIDRAILYGAAEVE